MTVENESRVIKTTAGDVTLSRMYGRKEARVYHSATWVDAGGREWAYQITTSLDLYLKSKVDLDRRLYDECLHGLAKGVFREVA